MDECRKAFEELVIKKHKIHRDHPSTHWAMVGFEAAWNALTESKVSGEQLTEWAMEVLEEFRAELHAPQSPEHVPEMVMGPGTASMNRLHEAQSPVVLGVEELRYIISNKENAAKVIHDILLVTARDSREDRYREALEVIRKEFKAWELSPSFKARSHVVSIGMICNEALATVGKEG